MEKIVSLAKTRGFVFPGSDIYGGLANSWDYGPLGVQLKNNVKAAWWKKFVQENPYNVGLDSAIIMNPRAWVASGHVGGFSDPLIDCKQCRARHRADNLVEDFNKENNITDVSISDKMSKHKGSVPRGRRIERCKSKKTTEEYVSLDQNQPSRRLVSGSRIDIPCMEAQPIRK